MIMNFSNEIIHYAHVIVNAEAKHADLPKTFTQIE